MLTGQENLWKGRHLVRQIAGKLGLLYYIVIVGQFTYYAFYFISLSNVAYKLVKTYLL